MKETPTLRQATDRRGSGANLMPLLIQSIEKLNSWQVGMQLAALWAWGVRHVR